MAALSKPLDVPGSAIASRVDDIVSASDSTNTFDSGTAFTAADQGIVGRGALPPTGALDLTATSASLSGSTFNYNINNAGTDPAAATTTGIYLSTDSTIATSDTRINTHATPSLAGGASDIESISLVLPTNLTPGTYYIGAIADYANTAAESDETNNASAAIPI